jgi:hypothetical protein
MSARTTKRGFGEMPSSARASHAPSHPAFSGSAAAAGEDDAAVVDQPRPKAPAAAPGLRPSSRASPLEVQMHRMRSPPGRAMVDHMQGPLVVVEIWTRNRIYLCDGQMRCVDVRDRATQRSEPKHVVIGAQLLGGHKRYRNTVHLSRPLPLPGTQAVFLRPTDRREPQAYTSEVERVVFNYQISSLELTSDTSEAWSDVTNKHLR